MASFFLQRQKTDRAMANSGMNICICAGPFHPSVGGIEEISRILALEFVKRGHHVEVLTTTIASSECGSDFPFTITRTNSHWTRWRAFVRCEIALFMNVSLNALPVAMMAGCKIILSHHGIYRFEQGSKLARALELIKRQLTRFFPNISVSRFVAAALPGQSRIVPNAYDNVLFPTSSGPRSRDFVFCGRLVSDKGVDLLVRAFAEVLLAHPDASLSIVGDGPERPGLESLALKMRAENSIVFLGILRGEKLADALRRHRCMVIPSIWEEPFGIVALEGIASCDLVIATRRGGLSDAVGPCGLMVEPSIAALADAMKSVLDAYDRGESIPGMPSTEMREHHLLQHRPGSIAQGYLESFHLAGH